jgi:hypothetical protein
MGTVQAALFPLGACRYVPRREALERVGTELDTLVILHRESFHRDLFVSKAKKFSFKPQKCVRPIHGQPLICIRAQPRLQKMCHGSRRERLVQIAAQLGVLGAG